MLFLRHSVDSGTSYSHVTR